MITIDLKLLELPSSCRILDIGCGTGRHTAEAYALDRAMVVGADPNEKDLHEARSRLQFHEQMGAHGNGQWHLTAADLLDLPFGDRHFNLVICSEVLEHISDYHRAIQESIRVLVPGGHLVVSVPRRWPETLCWALSNQYRTSAGGHVRIFAAQSLIKLIRAQGLTHRHTHHAHGLHTPYWWLRCLVGVERDQLWPVKRYHDLLTWDMMQKPTLTRILERWLNPLMGKSVVLYFSKPANPSTK